MKIISSEPASQSMNSISKKNLNVKKYRSQAFLLSSFSKQKIKEQSLSDQDCSLEEEKSPIKKEAIYGKSEGRHSVEDDS